MVKEIKYSGYTASPSDYEAPDGDLAAVLNVVPEEGSLSPVLPPRQLFQLSEGGTVRFVHETSYIRNYIILHPDNTITWRTQDDADQYSHGTLSHDFSDRTIHQINAIGNTLIVLADDGTHYFLWKGYRNGTEQEGDDPKEYLYLSTHIPELPISFGLDTAHEATRPGVDYEDIKYSEVHATDFEIDKVVTIHDSSTVERWFYAEGSNIQEVQNMILGAANKVIAEAAEYGYFCMPFLVRYAYRLYDGETLIMHSAPVLMMAGDGVPFAYFKYRRDTSIGYFNAGAYFFRLDYAIREYALSQLSNWGDIVKSVDIFVSAPIYKYDQAAKEWDRSFAQNDTWTLYEHKSGSPTFESYMSDKIYVSNNRDKRGTDTLAEYPHRKRTAADFGDNVPSIIQLPSRNNDDFIKDITDCSTFYLLKSIDIKDLKTTRTVINVERGYLTNLIAKEIMTDDYDSHDTIIPKYSFGYNARLNLVDLQKRLFGGFLPSSLFHFTDSVSDTYSPYDNAVVSVFFFIRQENKEIIINGGSAPFAANTPFVYLYHPNIHTYKAIISVASKGNTKLYELPMHSHEKLNGACFFGGYNFDLYDGSHDYTGDSPIVTDETDRVLNLPNKIYTSEVNNPFFFPVSHISTVGIGSIMAISSASKALSQGQFGQHPLYAFTSEGVWALEVTKTGTLVPAQPFTRDVCINRDSITQLDSSVLFATDRGLMLITGSTSICISDNLDYSQAFQISSLPHSDKLLSLVGFTHADLGYVSFHEFIRGCRMLYSYVRQHIIVFNREYPYAYVYSLKSKSWGMMPSTIALTIPSYPEALAQLADGTIVDYSSVAEGQETTGIKGVLITRPLKLDLPNALKTVDTVIQRGNFERGHVKSAIYGSRDLINWNIVHTSKDHRLSGFFGTPYKYFRIVLLCDLAPTESIYGCTIQYTPRFTNRLR